MQPNVQPIGPSARNSGGAIEVHAPNVDPDLRKFLAAARPRGARFTRKVIYRSGQVVSDTVVRDTMPRTAAQPAHEPFTKPRRGLPPWLTPGNPGNSGGKPGRSGRPIGSRTRHGPRRRLSREARRRDQARKLAPFICAETVQPAMERVLDAGRLPVDQVIAVLTATLEIIRLGTGPEGLTEGECFVRGCGDLAIIPAITTELAPVLRDPHHPHYSALRSLMREAKARRAGKADE